MEFVNFFFLFFITFNLFHNMYEKITQAWIDDVKSFISKCVIRKCLRRPWIVMRVWNYWWDLKQFLLKFSQKFYQNLHRLNNTIQTKWSKQIWSSFIELRNKCWENETKSIVFDKWYTIFMLCGFAPILRFRLKIPIHNVWK